VILCLHCFSLSPTGAIFCQSCARSFGARLCGSKKRHRNHMAAQFCAQCGSDNLTDATLYLPLGCVTWLLSWALVFVIAWWLQPYLRPAANSALNTALCWALCLLNYVIYWSIVLFMIYMALTLIPGDVGKYLRQAYASAIRLAPRLAAGALKGAFALLRGIVGNARSLRP
jgi:ribosomal protein L40E